MGTSVQKKSLDESIIQWINSEKRDFNQGLKLMRAAGYKPHVSKHIEAWGSGDPRSIRALNMEFRNYLRESRKAIKAKSQRSNPRTPPEDKETQWASNIEKELEQEYPTPIKKALTEFHSLYQRRSILHRELKAIGELNDEKSVNERKRKLTLIDAISRRMDILWGIFEKYKTDSSLPEESFFSQPFDPEQEKEPGQPTGYREYVLPADLEGLKKLKENLRIKISKAKNRLEYQSEKKGEKPNPMLEGPKRAELEKRIVELEKQKETVEYRIVELK
jgi:hypothetical protein